LRSSACSSIYYSTHHTTVEFATTCVAAFTDGHVIESILARCSGIKSILSQVVESFNTNRIKSIFAHLSSNQQVLLQRRRPQEEKVVESRSRLVPSHAFGSVSTYTHSQFLSWDSTSVAIEISSRSCSQQARRPSCEYVAHLMPNSFFYKKPPTPKFSHLCTKSKTLYIPKTDIIKERRLLLYSTPLHPFAPLLCRLIFRL